MSTVIGGSHLRGPLLALLLLAGAVARAVVLPLPGTLDVPDWKATAFVASEDLLGVWGHGGSPPEERRLIWQDVNATTEYPPISQLEMALVGRIYRAIEPDFRDSAVLTALIKAPGLLAELLLVIVLLTWGRQLMGDAAVWAALAFWLNPSIWLGGSVLGYLDAQMAVPATIALLAAVRRKPALAGFLMAVAVLTKPQAIFVLPVVWLVAANASGAWRWRDAATATAAGLAVAAAALLPLVAAGTWPSYWRAVQRMGEHDLVSGTAANVWWVIGWAAGSWERLSELGWWGVLTRPATMIRISTVTAAGLPNPRTIGVALTAIALLWAAWRCRRGATLSGGALAGAWCVLAYFMLSGQVHENHAYLAVPFLGVAAALRPELRRLYWLISAAFFLNLYLFYGFGQTWPPAFDRAWTIVDATLWLSIGFGLLVLWLTREVIVASRESAMPRA